MVGKKWDREEYVLGYKPKTKETYYIGLNTLVGPKWPTKLWSAKKWDQLEDLLGCGGYKITRQDKQPKEVLRNLEKYIDWINSSKIIISNDSLGLHLGIALKKRVLGLFGPTPHLEIEFYGRGKAILPSPYPNCAPCFSNKCLRSQNCLENINIEQAYKEVLKIK